MINNSPSCFHPILPELRRVWSFSLLLTQQDIDYYSKKIYGKYAQRCKTKKNLKQHRTVDISLNFSIISCHGPVWRGPYQSCFPQVRRARHTMLKGYRCERDRALVHVTTTDGSVGFDDGIIEENVGFFFIFSN